MGNQKPGRTRTWAVELVQSQGRTEAVFRHTDAPGSTWIWDSTLVWPQVGAMTEREILSEIYAAVLIFMERRA